VKIYFVRHGDTDYRTLDARGVRGWARSFAPLSPMGRVQMDVIAKDYRLQEAEAILCSSYARALESAALLNRKLNKPIYVEYDLHEWLPNKDSLADLDDAKAQQAYEEFRYYSGLGLDNKPKTPPPADKRIWESLEEVRERALKALRRYKHLSSVIVVSHAVLIASLIGVQRAIQHAEIVPFELDIEADDMPQQSKTSSPSYRR